MKLEKDGGGQLRSWEPAWIADGDDIIKRVRACEVTGLGGIARIRHRCEQRGGENEEIVSV
jgi:hypothetical protein